MFLEVEKTGDLPKGGFFQNVLEEGLSLQSTHKVPLLKFYCLFEAQ